MPKQAVRLLVLVALLFAARVASAENITVKNGSEYAIHHFFLSPGDDKHWGADQLG